MQRQRLPTADDLRPQLCANIAALCFQLFPDGSICGREFCIGDINGNKGQSLRVHLDGAKAGWWCDFATGDKSKSPFDLIEKNRGFGDFKETLRWAGAWLGSGVNSIRLPVDRKIALSKEKEDDWEPIVPPPADAPWPDISLFAGARAVYSYKDLEGEATHYIRKYIRDGKKDFRPLTYGKLNGRIGWHSKHVKEPRPLYGLERLKFSNSVILCEGEKAAHGCSTLDDDEL